LSQPWSASDSITAFAADSFPARTVKFVVPQAPGGATDVFARKFAQVLSEKWGQPVIVENRAGAGGVVGTDAVAKSRAGRTHAAR
jgi:tripartite-type tricarboxylate transporter receptor subunit TctC